LISGELEDVCPTDEFPAITSTGELPAVKGQQRTGRHRQRRQPPAYHLLPLLAVLCVQAGLSLRLVWSNTAFQDEALYLWAGRLEWAHWLHGAALPNYAFQTYFSGAPVVYPPLGALANDVGGLAGARMLSLVFMLGATVLLYSATHRLTLDRRAAVVAAAVFAFLGPTQNLGAFATYDAMALFLLALASWLAIRSGGRWGELFLAACALTLVAADAAKYASLLWNPVVIALAVLGPAKGTPLRASGRGIRLAIYGTALALPLLFLVGGRSYVTGLMFTTLSRQIPGTVPAFDVLADAFNWIGVALVLALLGLALIFSTGHKRAYWLCGILAAAATLAPLNQARINTLTSLQKHVTFGVWFAAIVAGYAATAMTRRVNPAKGWRVPAVAVAAILILGIFQASNMFTWWPNASGMTRELGVAVSQEKCPCLISEWDSAMYYLPQLQANAVIVNPYQFYYWDSSTRHELVNIPAYEQAIKAGYFGVVELDDAEEAGSFTPTRRALASSRNYRLMATIPASNQKAPFTIWVRVK